MSIPSSRPSGLARLQAPAIVAVVAGLILIAAPGVQRRRHQIEREACIENLALLMAAKERVASRKALPEGAVVTMDDLLADGAVITEAPIFTDEESSKTFKLNPIGTRPTCVYRGEALDPLVDYDKLPRYYKPEPIDEETLGEEAATGAAAVS
jgi:hypothetical protein